MQPLDLRYTITISGTDYVLPNAPSGWEDTLVNFKRSPTYFGMIRNFSIPLLFVLDGAWLLRKEFYTKGLNARATLLIEELDKKTWKYRQLVKSSFDFSKFRDLVNEVEINLMESSISEQIKAFDKQVYTIPLNVPEAVNVRVPGIGVIERGIAIFGGFFTYGLSNNPNIVRSAVLQVVTNSFFNEAVTFQEQEDLTIVLTDIGDTENWILRANEDTNVKLEGRLDGTFQNNTPGSDISLLAVNQDGEILATLFSLVSTSLGQVPFDIDFSLSLELENGTKVYLVWKTTLTNTFVLPRSITPNTGEIEISNSSVTTETIVKGLKAVDLFRALILKMNDNLPVKTQSFLLSNDWKNMVITSGDAIRELDRPTIKTSFEDFFLSMNAIMSVGFGIENDTAVLERKDYWMRSNLEIVDLGNVDFVDLSLAEDLIFNTVKVGYPDKDYSVDYGREEVNSTQYWSTPITRQQKELDIVSRYRADQFGIEDLRLTTLQDNENKRDKESDNDTFVIIVKKFPGLDGVFDVQGSEAYKAGNGIQGISQRESYYNLSITPKKNLLRHASYLRGVLHRFESRNLIFETAEKNGELVTIDNSNNRVAESDSILINFLEAPFFQPYYLKINTKIPVDTQYLLTLNPTGVVHCTLFGQRFSGYINEVSVNVPRNASQEWTLLLTPNSDLSKLVR